MTWRVFAHLASGRAPASDRLDRCEATRCATRLGRPPGACRSLLRPPAPRARRRLPKHATSAMRRAEGIVDIKDLQLARLHRRAELVEQSRAEPRRLGLARRVLQTADGRLRGQRRTALRTAANCKFHRRIVPQYAAPAGHPESRSSSAGTSDRGYGLHSASRQRHRADTFLAQRVEARGSLLASAMSGCRCLPERYPPAGHVVLHNTRSRIPPRCPPISLARPDHSAAVGDRWQVQTAHFRKQR
jgi:hypothetical protein